ncbi:hypothetical protein ACP4OV_011794 [Aristida adscensionis]
MPPMTRSMARLAAAGRAAAALGPRVGPLAPALHHTVPIVVAPASIVDGRRVGLHPVRLRLGIPAPPLLDGPRAAAALLLRHEGFQETTLVGPHTCSARHLLDDLVATHVDATALLLEGRATAQVGSYPGSLGDLGDLAPPLHAGAPHVFHLHPRSGAGAALLHHLADSLAAPTLAGSIELSDSLAAAPPLHASRAGLRQIQQASRAATLVGLLAHPDNLGALAAPLHASRTAAARLAAAGRAAAALGPRVGPLAPALHHTVPIVVAPASIVDGRRVGLHPVRLRLGVPAPPLLDAPRAAAALLLRHEGFQETTLVGPHTCSARHLLDDLVATHVDATALLLEGRATAQVGSYPGSLGDLGDLAPPLHAGAPHVFHLHPRSGAGAALLHHLADSLAAPTLAGSIELSDSLAAAPPLHASRAGLRQIQQASRAATLVGLLAHPDNLGALAAPLHASRAVAALLPRRGAAALLHAPRGAAGLLDGSRGPTLVRQHPGSLRTLASPIGTRATQILGRRPPPLVGAQLGLRFSTSAAEHSDDEKPEEAAVGERGKSDVHRGGEQPEDAAVGERGKSDVHRGGELPEDAAVGERGKSDLYRGGEKPDVPDSEDLIERMEAFILHTWNNAERRAKLARRNQTMLILVMVLCELLVVLFCAVAFGVNYMLREIKSKADEVTGMPRRLAERLKEGLKWRGEKMEEPEEEEPEEESDHFWSP